MDFRASYYSQLALFIQNRMGCVEDGDWTDKNIMILPLEQEPNLANLYYCLHQKSQHISQLSNYTRERIKWADDVNIISNAFIG